MEQIVETSRVHDTGSVTKRRVAPRCSVLLAINPPLACKLAFSSSRQVVALLNLPYGH